MSTPQDGSDHDLFEIEKAFKEMIDQLESAGIDTRGGFFSMRMLVLILMSSEESVPEEKWRLTSKQIQEMPSKTTRQRIILMKNYTKDAR